jgi:hypothetical protein
MWDTITQHTGLKLVAVVLALAAWFYVNLKNYDTAEIEVPVRLRAPDGWYILDRPTQKLPVTLQGLGVDLGRVNKESVYVDVDIAKRRTAELPVNPTQPYDVRVEVEPVDIQNLPPGVLVDADRLALRAIHVKLDKIVEKLLTVSVDEEEIQSRVAEGTHVHKVYPVPKQVIVRGPQSVLVRLETIEPVLPPVDDMPPLELRSKRPLDPTPRVDGKPVGPAGCLEPDPPAVDLWIVGVPKTQEKTVTDVRLDVLGRSGYVYTVLDADKKAPLRTVPKVALRGPEKALEKLAVRAFVDVSDIDNPREQPEVTRKVQFDVPDGVEILGDPPEVTVQIKPPA